MLVICTGIPGVGKTTVMESMRALLEQRGTACLIVNFGTIMFEVAFKEKIVDDRDRMRRLPAEVQRHIQRKAAEHIANLARGETVILDTHCTIKTKQGFFPGLPRAVLDDLAPDAMVLVEAPAEEIYLRRMGDPTRSRDDDSQEDIRAHQMMNRAYAASYSAYSGCCVKIIENRQGQAEKAAHDFFAVMGV